jgi:hypothetical protein
MLNTSYYLKVFGLWLLIGSYGTILFAQAGNNNSAVSARVAINATATVMDSIEMSTLANITLGSASIGSEQVFINPQLDENSGKLLVTGRPNATIRITYTAQQALSRVGGPESLVFVYYLSGNADDNQLNSETLNVSRTDMRLGSNGRFYIWIGGMVNLQNVVFGQYEGEFSVEIEYI